MATNQAAYYDLYRHSRYGNPIKFMYKDLKLTPSYSIGIALTDTLDDFISSNNIEPQLAMKIIANFDKAFSEMIADKVKSRLSFKVRTCARHLANSSNSSTGPSGHLPLL